jgi:putative oxidoreductase
LTGGQHYCATANQRADNSFQGAKMKAPFLIGRLLFGGFFLYNGINHLRNRKQMAPYAGSKGVPAPELSVALTGVPLIVGGASLLLGVKPKLGALAILGFLAGVSPIMHDFWSKEDPNERMNDMVNFSKNLALAGGALALMGVEEPWEASIAGGHRSSLGKRVKALGRKLAA